MSPVVIVNEEYLPIYVVTINRPERKNAVDRATAFALYDAFKRFDEDERFSVAILKGAGDAFCAGADLKSMLKNSKRDSAGGNPLNKDMDQLAPMGVTRMLLSKPVIAAISGPAVAGGLELALWCDLRVADTTAYFGVFCRMRGVPLIDGGTVRLPRLIGQSAASDLILTGRQVNAAEAQRLNLINYLVDTHGGSSSSSEETVFSRALGLARSIARHPQRCLRHDRLSMLEAASGVPTKVLMEREFALGLDTLNSDDFGGAVEEFVGRAKM